MTAGRQPTVGDYDPVTGRMTMSIGFTLFSRRERRECFAAMRAAGLEVHGAGLGLVIPRGVLATGTEAQFLAYGAAQRAITGVSGGDGGDISLATWRIRNNYYDQARRDRLDGPP